MLLLLRRILLQTAGMLGLLIQKFMPVLRNEGTPVTEENLRRMLRGGEHVRDLQEQRERRIPNHSNLRRGNMLLLLREYLLRLL